MIGNSKNQLQFMTGQSGLKFLVILGKAIFKYQTTQNTHQRRQVFVVFLQKFQGNGCLVEIQLVLKQQNFSTSPVTTNIFLFLKYLYYDFTPIKLVNID